MCIVREEAIKEYRWALLAVPSFGLKAHTGGVVTNMVGRIFIQRRQECFCALFLYNL